MDDLVRGAGPMIRRLAERIASQHQWAQALIDADDLEQEGLMAAYQVAARFEKERNIQFNTVAYARISGAMIDAIRAAFGLRKKNHLVAYQISSLVLDRQALSEYEPPIDDTDEYESAADEVLAPYLSQRDREIVRLYFLEDLTMKAIGRRLGLSESRVCQIVNGVLEESVRHCHERGLDRWMV